MKPIGRVDFYRYKDEIDRLLVKPYKKDAALFYGSSTFAFWKEIDEEFKDYNAINLGFGGSTSDEALYLYDSVIKRLDCKYLVWYYGDNEPVCGYTFKETKKLYKACWNKFRKDFKGVKIITILTKTSPARDEYKEYVNKLNAWERRFTKFHKWISYVETADLCKDENGNYKLDSYIEDKLHFSKKAYAIIKERLLKEFK